MTEPNAPTSENTRLGRGAQIGWALLICATLFVCYFSQLGAIGFVGPDEPRYAWIARDMMETGDCVTPRLYGNPWFEKPPLYYWGAALSFKRLGVSETAARLPSAVCALLATLVLAWLARRLYGAGATRWLLLLLPTTVGMIGFSHAAATDMPFSAMLTIAMVCSAVALGLTRNEDTPILPRTPWLALILFGFSLGLAMLAKGPAAIVLSGGATFFWALLTRRWRDALRLLHPAAIVSFCATFLPWYVLCARRNPDFLRVFLIDHNFKRYLTPEFQHIQPFWFYVPVLLVAFLPWTALLLWSSLRGALRLVRTRSASHSTILFLCWAGFCLVFFSISQSKLPGYVLPCLAPTCLLVAAALTEFANGHAASFRAAMSLMALLFFALFVFSEIGASKYHLMSAANGGGRIILVLLGMANAFLVFYPEDELSNRTGLRSGACALPVLVAVMLTTFLLPSFFRLDPSGRKLARELQLRNIPTSQLAIGEIGRGLHFSLNFYLHQEIKDWSQDNAKKEYVLSDRPGCRALHPTPFACEPVTFDEGSTGAFLNHIVMSGSVSGSADGGQVDKKE